MTTRYHGTTANRTRFYKYLQSQVTSQNKSDTSQTWVIKVLLLKDASISRLKKFSVFWTPCLQNTQAKVLL